MGIMVSNVNPLQTNNDSVVRGPHRYTRPTCHTWYGKPISPSSQVINGSGKKSHDAAIKIEIFKGLKRTYAPRKGHPKP